MFLIYTVVVQSPDECEWTKSVKQLHQVTTQYLSILDLTPPNIDICTLNRGHTKYKSTKTVKTHALNVLDVMRYKSNGFNDVYNQIKYYIGNKWKSDLLDKWNIGASLSPKITLQIQNASEVNDKSFNTIATMTNNALGWRLYSSHNSKFEFRKQIQSITARIMDLSLERASFNAYDRRKHAKYTVYYMNDLEIMAQCLDKWVNNNKWVYLPHFNDEIWWTQGFDKATAGGLVMIVGLVWATLSVKDCMISLYIPGDVKEDATNILKCHHSMNYPKQLHWQALSKRPASITVVFYNVSADGSLNSRLVQSCIVMINAKLQLKVNELKTENQILLQNEFSPLLKPYQLNLQQFDKSWHLNKSKKRQQLNNLKTALIAIKSWEAQYNRPSDLMCITEHERRGNFDPNSMYTLFKVVNLT